MSARYRIEEGSIDLPQGFVDRSTNVFVPAQGTPPPVSLNISRDTLTEGATLASYVEQQIVLLKANLRNYTIINRSEAKLGTGNHALAGEQVIATHGDKKAIIYLRQAAFIHAPQRVLVLSCTSAKALDGEQEATWQQWLASFQAAGSD